MKRYSTLRTTVAVMTILAFSATIVLPAASLHAIQQQKTSSAPPGTLMIVRLSEAIGSDRNQPGDAVYAELAEPITSGGSIVFPVGTQVLGHINSVTSSGRGQRNGEIDFVFDHIRTADGSDISIVANLEGASEYTRDSWKKRLYSMAIAVGAGILVSKIFGGSVRRGILIGGAAGTGYVLYNKGDEIVLPAGTTINLVLEETVNVSYQFAGVAPGEAEKPAKATTESTMKTGMIVAGPVVDVLLRSGEKKSGQLLGITSDSGVLLKVDYGQLDIPFKDVKELVFDAQVKGSFKLQSDDAILLKNGNILNGYFLGLEEGKLIINNQYGELRVPLSDVARIVFGS